MLTKVIFEYSDGTRKSLTDNDLRMWDTFNLQVASFAHTHGMNPPWDNIRWKEEGKIPNNEQKTTQEKDSQENTSKENSETKGA